jgi:hypothetical protein
MKNKFAKHYEANSRIYDDMVKAGKLDIHDLMAAGNLGGKYSYAEQDEANNRINEYVKTFLKKNEGNEIAEKFASSFPVVQEFKPDPKKWQEYDQEQMGRLAESLHYNWNNKDDRSALMKQLQGQTILENKKKIYDEYKKEHPAAAWINENIFAPNSSERSKRGEDITNTDTALDALNTISFFTPGGFGKSAAKKIAADVAANAALGVAEDVNLDRELGWHNIVAPAFGAGLGQTIAAAPRLVKSAMDFVGNNADGNSIGKKFGDQIEDKINNALGDPVGDASKRISEEASIARQSVPAKDRQRFFRSDSKESTYNAYKKEKLDNFETPATKEEVADIRYKSKRAQYAQNPETYFRDRKAGVLSDELAEKLSKDKDFSLVMKDYMENQTKSQARKTAEKVAKAQARGLVKQGGRGYIIESQNEARHNVKNEERNDIDWFKTNYARDWAAGFKPHGNENEPIMKAYKEWEEDQKKNKRPSIREVM